MLSICEFGLGLPSCRSQKLWNPRKISAARFAADLPLEEGVTRKNPSLTQIPANWKSIGTLLYSGANGTNAGNLMGVQDHLRLAPLAAVTAGTPESEK